MRCHIFPHNGFPTLLRTSVALQKQEHKAIIRNDPALSKTKSGVPMCLFDPTTSCVAEGISPANDLCNRRRANSRKENVNVFVRWNDACQCKMGCQPPPAHTHTFQVEG